MKYKINISKTFFEDLEKTLLYLACSNKERAIEFKDLIIKKIKSLEDLPYLYPFIYNDLFPNRKYRKAVIEENYLFIYKIENDEVFVEYFIDSRSDYIKILNEDN